jgi:hypothetical protein
MHSIIPDWQEIFSYSQPFEYTKPLNYTISYCTKTKRIKINATLGNTKLDMDVETERLIWENAVLTKPNLSQFSVNWS